MADFSESLSDKQIQFIKEQHMFFVSTAPNDGRINLSPKGMDTFRVLSPTKVAYLDFVGSGNETAAHLLENGRITIMFNSYTRNPLILRLYGRGQFHLPDSDGFKELMPLFDEQPGIRQIFEIDVNSVQGSCGFAVPVYELVSERKTLTDWAEKKGPKVIQDYIDNNNQTSIDGLPTGQK